MPAQVSCSVVVATCQRRHSLAETLQSLNLQSVLDFEVIVVCDGEDPPTLAFSREFQPAYPIRWIFKTHRAGLAAARNTGVAAAKGSLLLFLDDDITASPEWLEQHCRRHQMLEDGEIAVVLGQMRNAFPHPPGSYSERLLREDSDRSLAAFHARCLKNKSCFPWAPHCGVNSSLPRSLFTRAGGFDEGPQLLHEDNEFGARLQDLGAQFLYEPGALVHHRNPKNLADSQLPRALMAGKSDLYRVRKKQQRLENTSRITTYHRSKPVRRLKEHLAWTYPDQARALAAAFRKAADLSHFKPFWRIWNALGTSAAYWEAIRAEGMTPESLAHLLGSPVPMLMLHGVCEPATECEREWNIDPGRFRRFAGWLAERNYRSVSPVAWVDGPKSPSSVVLTFDDAFEDFYSHAYPILEHFGQTATVFVVWDRIGQTNLWDGHLHVRQRRLMTAGQIREMHRLGITIGSHSLTHACLPDLSTKELRREVAESKLRLEDLLGAEVSSFAYPGGRVDPRVRAAVAEAGYRVAMAVGQGLAWWGDPLLFPRINVSAKDNLAGFAAKVSTGRGLSQNLVHLLARTVRAGLGLLPAGVSESLGADIRGSHQALVRRWWQWKDAQFMRPESTRPGPE